MKNALRRAACLLSDPKLFPFFLLALCAAAYAPMITKVGFYWDDFPINWIATTMGGEGLARYFSTNRPVWGLIYQLTTPIVGSTPMAWQIFALLLRWATGLALWWLLHLLWPGRATFAAWAAALFVVYPGFSQQFIAFLYSHFYIVLIDFLVSLSLMVLALRMPKRRFWWLTAASLALSLLNMLAMEYFFLLDLLRPLLIWLVLSESIPDRRQRVRRTLVVWLPYLALFIAAMFWRTVLFGFQTYQPALMSRLKAQPIQAIARLIPLVLRDVWMTSAGAWARVFTAPAVADVGARNLQRYWLIAIASAFVGLLFMVLYRPVERKDHRWAWQPIGLGLLSLFIAGGPFWLTDLQIGLVFPNDRFTIPFMLGTSLVFAGLLQLIPGPRWSKAALLGIFLGFACAVQFGNAVDYTRDWTVQRSMFWQMVWRMPDLQPGTILLSNELPVEHYTDNSLSAPLNWTYDPRNDPSQMKYILYYPTIRRTTSLGNYQKHYPVTENYLAATFHSTTDQIVTFYFNPPGCLRVLDPQVEDVNWMVPVYLRDTLRISTLTPILPAPQPGKPGTLRPPAAIFGSEISHGWCYYYEKADLARQVGNWNEVVRLGEEASTSSDYPNDPAERLPFIEAYAHTGQWSRAVELSRQTSDITTVMDPVLCKLWARIEQQTPETAEQQEAVKTIRDAFACGSSK